MAEDLSFQEVEELLETVINNKKLVKLSLEGGDRFLIFSYPPPQDILISRYVRERALSEASSMGLPSRKDVEATIKERQLASNDAAEIAVREEKILAQQRLLNLTKIPARREPVEENIRRLASEIEAIKAKTDHLYIMTREFRADEESILYLSWASSYTISGERYWDSFESFEKETDLVFRSALINEFSKFNRGLPIGSIRLLARHILWRIRYTAALKIGGSLFSNGLDDLTSDQQSLLYWSNYYQSIYEMMPDDQPDSDVIEDDEALDHYMEDYFERREAERNEGRLKRGSGSKGRLSSGMSDEVIVTSNHPEYLGMRYEDKRARAEEGVSDIEVVSPNSRRAQNRRAARRE